MKAKSVVKQQSTSPNNVNESNKIATLDSSKNTDKSFAKYLNDLVEGQAKSA